MNEPSLKLLGLARRAGHLALGEEPVSDACESKKARLVLLAADAGDTIAHRAQRWCGSGIPLVVTDAEKSALGFSVGRSTCAVLAVTDQGLASALVEKMAGEREELKELSEQMNAKTKRFQFRKEKKQRAKSAAR